MNNILLNRANYPAYALYSSCLQCGACTSVCTAASRDKRYNPRRMIEYLLCGRGLSVRDYPLPECFSCHACECICRNGIRIADIVKLLKGVQPQDGTNIYLRSLIETGLCVTPEVHHPEKFPEWGFAWDNIHSDMIKLRSELGLEGLQRAIPEESLDEIRAIVKLTADREIGERKLVETMKRIPEKRIYLFHSCIADTHYPGITTSIKYLFDLLGIDYIDDPAHSTCAGFGYYGDKIPFATMLALNARNLALAEQAGYPNVAPVCQTSYGVLMKTVGILSNDSIGEQINREVLKKVNPKLKYRGDANIAHVSEILWSQRAKLKAKLKFRFDGLRVATHNGCHYTRLFRDKAIPDLLDDLVVVTGAEPVEYTKKSLCCGMGFGHTIEAERRYLTRDIASRKLISAKEAGADLMVVACPGCQMTLDRNQELIERETGLELQLPVLNYAQFIALAMGADIYSVAGMQFHSVPFGQVMEKMELV